MKKFLLQARTAIMAASSGKMRNLFLAFFVCLGFMTANADDVVTVECPNMDGSSAGSIIVNLQTDADEYSGYQFYIYVPQGMTFLSDNKMAKNIEDGDVVDPDESSMNYKWGKKTGDLGELEGYDCYLLTAYDGGQVVFKSSTGGSLVKIPYEAGEFTPKAIILNNIVLSAPGIGGKKTVIEKVVGPDPTPTTESYNLTYMLDGSVYKTYTYEVGEAITPEPDPEPREGYTFSGWSEIPAVMPAHDVEVTGTFTKDAEDDVVTVEYPNMKSGVAGNITVNLQTNANEYSGYQFYIYVPQGMTFLSDSKMAKNIEDGTVIDPEESSMTYKWGKKTGDLGTLEGYDCYLLTAYDGGQVVFNSTEGGSLVTIPYEGGEFTPKSIILNNIVLSAPSGKKTVIEKVVGPEPTPTTESYNLTYMLDGSVYKTYTYEVGEAITPEPDPEPREGYTFSGWSEIPAVMPAHDVEVTGTFTKDGPDAVVTVEYPDMKSGVAGNITVNLQTKANEYSGYQFYIYVPQGMTFLSDNKMAKIIEDGTVINPEESSMTYKWGKKTGNLGTLEGYDCYLMTAYDGGQVVFNSTEGGSLVTIPYEGGEFTPKAIILNNIVLSAPSGKKTVIERVDGPVPPVESYNLTYYIDGTVYKTYTYEVGEAITPEPDPEPREGYTWSGWSEIPAVMPAHDVDVNGTFTKDEDTDISKYDNIIYFDKINALAGTQQTVSLKLKNTAEIGAGSFDIQLPEGVTIATKTNGKYNITLNTTDERCEDQTISATQLSTGDIRVVFMSASATPFYGNEGAIFDIVINVSGEMEEGDYKVYLKNILLSELDGITKHEIDEVRSTMTVSTYVRGDANNDQVVDMADAMSIINYVLEKPAEDFNIKGADANLDGEVDMADVMTIVNYVLNEGNWPTHNENARSFENYFKETYVNE